MWELLVAYCPHILAALSVTMATAAIVHVVMTKDDVRAATGWVGVVLLSPVLGALIYAVAGINRIRRASIASGRMRTGSAARKAQSDVPRALVADLFGERFTAVKTLGDRVAQHAMKAGNAIRMLKDGDEAYAEMIRAIDEARRSVILETYIFDRDAIGLRVAEALIRAAGRGIAVRVLIDAVGARYTTPSIVGELRGGGVPVELFNGRLITGLRLPYANLRTHRKILVVDGRVAFVGGMRGTAIIVIEPGTSGVYHTCGHRLTALSLALQIGKASIYLLDAEEIIAAQGHFATVLVAQAANGDLESSLVLHKLRSQYLAYFAGPRSGVGRQALAKNGSSAGESQLGNVPGIVVVSADTLHEVRLDCDSTAISLAKHKEALSFAVLRLLDVQPVFNHKY